MTRLSSRFRPLAAAAVLALLAGQASADTIILKDGTTYHGRILRETDRYVEIKTTVSNIEITMQVERWRIRELINEDDAPVDDPAIPVKPDPGPTLIEPSTNSASAGAVETKTTLKRDGYQLVLEVPIEGEFGNDLYPKSIAVALEWAVENGVTDVVFRIDSGGGQVWVAEKIVEIMERYEDDLRYHGLIESAISASIWPMFTCDTITMAPGADFGGAVVFRIRTGNVEVDKKMNSIMAAKLSSAAESKGHNPAVVRAMMVSDYELWKYRRAGTSMPWRLTGDSDEAQADGMEAELVDRSDEILTLTTKSADELGIAPALSDKSLEAFATAVSLGPWDNAGEFGIDASEKWNDRSDTLRDKIETTVKSLIVEMARMGGANTVGAAGLSVNTARRKMAELRRYLRQADNLEMDSYIKSFEDFDLDFIQNEIERVAAEVRRVRAGP